MSQDIFKFKIVPIVSQRKGCPPHSILQIITGKPDVASLYYIPYRIINGFLLTHQVAPLMPLFNPILVTCHYNDKATKPL